MTPPLALPDPAETMPSAIDFPANADHPLPVYLRPRPVVRKTPPVEDLALLLVVIGFVIWSVAFAYRMSA